MLRLILRFARCSRGLHSPDKRRVKHDGNGWVGTCANCGRRVRKDPRQSKWVIDQ